MPNLQRSLANRSSSAPKQTIDRAESPGTYIGSLWQADFGCDRVDFRRLTKPIADYPQVYFYSQARFFVVPATERRSEVVVRSLTGARPKNPTVYGNHEAMKWQKIL